MSGVVIRHREPGPHRSSSNSGQRMWRDSFVVQQADTTPHPSEEVKGRPRAAGDEHAVFFAGSTRDARDDRGKLSPSWLPHRSALRSAVPLRCASQWQNPSTHTRLVSAMLTVLLPQCSLGVSHAGHFMVGERHPSAPHIHRAFRISHSILVAELTSLRTALAPTLASPVAGVS